jgi:hypothetical protein
MLLESILSRAAAAALWAVIGLGLGAVVRKQVAAIVGLFVWMQIVENLLVDSVPRVSRFMAGASAGQSPGNAPEHCTRPRPAPCSP